MAIYDANIVARYVLYKSDAINQKKLHKLMYYIYQWYLYLKNESSSCIVNRLFNNTFQAWVHGPVLNEIYPLYADYSFKPIEVVKFDLKQIADEDRNIIDEVLRIYGAYSADELEDISHQEQAWIVPRNGLDKHDPSYALLDDRLIYDEIERLN